VQLTRECSKGLGQDRCGVSCTPAARDSFLLIICTRHLYALYCLLRRELETSADMSVNSCGASALPEIFRDSGWSTLGTSILSTSNCGNPALRLFGFGPVAADGYGLGYIIKDDGLSVCAASKHLQTRRFLDTLQGYLEEVQRVLVALVRSANERPEPFVDHAGVLRDSKTGRRINGSVPVNDDEEEVDSIRAFLFPFLVSEMR
jgi:carnitine O-acetyltransferase